MGLIPRRACASILELRRYVVCHGMMTGILAEHLHAEDLSGEKDKEEQKQARRRGKPVRDYHCGRRNGRSSVSALPSREEFSEARRSKPGDLYRNQQGH